MFSSPVFFVFDALFHSVTDLFYLAIGWALVILVSKTGWKRHLKWLVPSAWSSTLVALYRLMVNLHLFGMHWTQFTYALRLTFLYTADIIGVYATVVLYQIWKAAIGSGKSNSDAEVAPQETHAVWPPPPTRLP